VTLPLYDTGIAGYYRAFLIARQKDFQLIINKNLKKFRPSYDTVGNLVGTMSGSYHHPIPG
jgi:hypothetical protein